MEKVQFFKVDDWGRPVFQSLDNKKVFFGSCEKLFGYSESENEILKTVSVDDLVYFGTSFNCEPMGTEAGDLEIVRKTPVEDTVTLTDNDKFNYMLLGRMKSDCEYFLGYGERYLGRPEGGSVEAHIKEMRELYAKLPVPPEWLTPEELNKYEKDMQE